MKLTAYKTKKITVEDKDIFKTLDEYLPKDIPEKSVVAVTSKIVAICEGRVVKIDEKNPRQKDELIESEAHIYLPREDNPYNLSFTVSNNILAVSAGIDESNGNGFYILWPKNPQKSANEIREFICKKYKRKYIGVVITDSKTTSMRWGVTGISLAHSGFLPLKNYVNTPDIFGRLFAFEQLSIIDALATATVLVAGEGREQTPLVVIEDLPMVQFQDRNPTEKELDSIKITLEEDMYGDFLKNAPWKKGKGK